MTDMSPTEQFIQTLGQTPKLASELGQNLSRLKQNSQQIIEYLTYPKTVSDDLSELENTLTLTSELLSFVSVVPEVGEAAAALKKSVDLLNSQVKPAADAAAKLEKAVKPLREGLEKIQPLLDKAIAAVSKVETSSQTFLDKFTAIYKCVESLPEGNAKETSEQYLNEFSSKCEPEVEVLNTAMTDANQAIEVFYNQLEEIEKALDPLKAISSAVDQIMDILNPIVDKLKELKHDLESIKIPIPLPYPQMVSLYDVFKTLSDFIDEAMKPIQSLVDELLKLLHVQLPSIPGLDYLLDLHLNIPEIPNIDELINTINAAFDKLMQELDLFNLECPPKNM